MNRLLNGFIGFVLLMVICLPSIAQHTPPVKWSLKPSATEAKIGEEIELIFTTDIPEGMHIYANDYKCDPMMVEIFFDGNPAKSYETSGNALAIGAHRYMDDVFECEVSNWAKKAELRQKVKILTADPIVSGILQYQVCFENGSCEMHEYTFNLTIKTKSVSK